MMFGFNKKQEIEIGEENPLIIPVRDIKQYLVDEYERANGLIEELKQKDKQLEQAEEIELKYNATLVTLDEFDRRLKLKDREIEELKTKIIKKDTRIREVSDDLNSHKILLNQAGVTKIEIEAKVKEEFASELIQLVNDLKGNLSKKQIIDLIEMKR